MQLIYLHGLDSDSNAIKAQLTDACVRKNLPQLVVHRPDLNLPPDQVVAKLRQLIAKDEKTVLIGSSLGGYFANLMSDLTGVPAVLLNPSIRPDVSFRRFLTDNFADKTLADDTVIYTTTGGWQIVFGDLAWFEQHRLQVKNPTRIGVFLRLGDELLDAYATRDFYADKGAKVLAEDGGDHRISDYEAYVERIVQWAYALILR